MQEVKYIGCCCSALQQPENGELGESVNNNQDGIVGGSTMCGWWETFDKVKAD